MKIVTATFAVVLLAGCATPQPILDTANRVAKMSDAMDRSVTNYVKSLRRARQADEQRLKELRDDAQLRRTSIQDKIQILTVAEGDRLAKLINAITIPAPLNPLGPESRAAPAADVKFDDSPLKRVSSLAWEIAKPPTATDEFKVLLEFAKTVNSDLQKATDSNNKKAGSSAQP
jgi:hypothetical protein